MGSIAQWWKSSASVVGRVILDGSLTSHSQVVTPEAIEPFSFSCIQARVGVGSREGAWGGGHLVGVAAPHVGVIPHSKSHLVSPATLLLLNS